MTLKPQLKKTSKVIIKLQKENVLKETNADVRKTVTHKKILKVSPGKMPYNIPIHLFL